MSKIVLLLNLDTVQNESIRVICDKPVENVTVISTLHLISIKD